MSFGGYGAFDDPYCYKGTETLKNKLGLRDAATLESFELEMTTLRAKDALPAGKFDRAHYRRVHRHFFQDVYSWAGKHRCLDPPRRLVSGSRCDRNRGHPHIAANGRSRFEN